MSNYQYQRGNRNNGDLTYWILAVVFLVCMPPIGFFMIVLKLLGGKKRTGRSATHLCPAVPMPAPVGARTTSPQPAAELTAEGLQRPAGRAGAQGPHDDHCGRRTYRGFPLCLPLQRQQRLLLAAPRRCRVVFGRHDEPAAHLLLPGRRRRMPVCGASPTEEGTPLPPVSGHDWTAHQHLPGLPGLRYRTSPAKVKDDLEDMLEENLFPNGYLDLGSGMAGDLGRRPVRSSQGGA